MEIQVIGVEKAEGRVSDTEMIASRVLSAGGVLTVDYEEVHIPVHEENDCKVSTGSTEYRQMMVYPNSIWRKMLFYRKTRPRVV